jgi:hypothetical protein
VARVAAKIFKLAVAFGVVFLSNNCVLNGSRMLWYLCIEPVLYNLQEKWSQKTTLLSNLFPEAQNCHKYNSGLE